MTKTKLQLAVDLYDHDTILDLLDKISEHLDIIELGTPCIKYNGIKIIHDVIDSYAVDVLADLKTMDAGEYEAAPFYRDGAKICTVLGCADIDTIAGVMRARNTLKGQMTQVDLINVYDKFKVIDDLLNLGVDIIGIHTGIDQQLKGMKPLEDLRHIKEYVGDRSLISVAGGIKLETLPDILKLNPDIVVVGGAITSSKEPVEVVKRMREMIDEK